MAMIVKKSFLRARRTGRSLEEKEPDVGRVKTGRTRRARQGLALAACGVLIGCAGQRAGDVGPKTEDRAVKTTPAKVQIPSPDHFTTKGKPTKTILTPNGPVEIYDPAKDAEFIDVFSTYRRSGYSFEDMLRLNKLYEKDFGRRVLLDYGRAGCKIMKDSFCQNHSVDYFRKNCGEERHFTKLELSKCEKDNYRALLPSGSTWIDHCALNGRLHKSQAYKEAPDLASSIRQFTETECIVWDREYFRGGK